MGSFIVKDLEANGILGLCTGVETLQRFQKAISVSNGSPVDVPHEEFLYWA